MTTRAAFAAATVLAASLLSGVAHSQSATPAIWQLAGRSNSVYLIGSVHALRNDGKALPATLQRAYQDADVLYMEIDLDDLDPTEVQQFTLSNGILPPEQTLAGVMGAERYTRAKTEAQKLGLDLDQLARLEPWVVAITAIQAQIIRLGLDPSAGVEQRLVEDAVRDGKEVRGLETVSDQFSVFDSLSLERQQEFLLMSLEEAVDLPQEIDKLIDAWSRGDVAALERLMSEGFEQFPDLYQPLVVARNRSWTRQIAELLDDDKDYLIVVGVLHLTGPDSVIEMLKTQGHGARRQ
ncbi:MAG TPA: TraB/GumN family protein [Steroidobacteraceae bacterium]|nr:TraB/GumN family protein [Steroidobacteraceae bacterium]